MGLFDWIGGAIQKVGETINQGIANFERATGVDIPLVGTDLSKEKKPATTLAPTPTPTPTFPKPEFKPEMSHTTAVPKGYTPITVPTPTTPTTPAIPTPTSTPVKTTSEDVKKTVETTVKLAEEQAKGKERIISPVLTEEELKQRGLKSWEKPIPVAYQTIGEGKKEIGKIKTEITPTQITKNIVFSEVPSSEEFKKMQEQLKQVGFEVEVGVKEGKPYLRGIAKVEEGKYFIRPEFLEEVKGEPTKNYFEIEGKKYYLKEEIKPLIEEIPLEAKYEIKEPTAFVIREKTELIEEEMKNIEAMNFGQRTGMIWSYSLLENPALFGIPSLVKPFIPLKGGGQFWRGEEGKREYLEELAKKKIEFKEKGAVGIAKQTALAIPQAEMSLLLPYGFGALAGKVATLEGTSTILGKVGTGALALGGLAGTGYYVIEPLSKGEEAESVARLIGVMAVLPLAKAGYEEGLKKFSPPPKEIVKIGYTEEEVKPTLRKMPEEDITARILKEPEVTKYIETRPTKEIIQVAQKGKIVYSDENMEIRRLGDLMVEVWKQPSGYPKVEAGDVISVAGIQKQYVGKFHGMDVYATYGVERPITFEKLPATEEFKPTFFKSEKPAPDVLKDILFVRKPFSKETYVFRPKELLKPEFWKSLPSKIKAILFKPKPTSKAIPTPSPKVVKTPEPSFISGGLGLESLEMETTYQPVAIEFTPKPQAPPKAPPSIFPPMYPETSTYQATTVQTLTPTTETVGLDIIDPLILGRRAILIPPEAIEREKPKPETPATKIPEKAMGKIPEKAREKIPEIPELPRRPEQFPVIIPTEIRKAKRPEEIGILPIQATMERELLSLKKRLALELKGEEWFKPIVILPPIPKKKYFVGTYSIQTQPQLELTQPLQPPTITPTEIPIEIPPTLPPILPPLPKIPEGFDIGKFAFGETRERKEEYHPSLEAIFFGIKVPKGKVKMPKKLTGFELRPELI